MNYTPKSTLNSRLEETISFSNTEFQPDTKYDLHPTNHTWQSKRPMSSQSPDFPGINANRVNAIRNQLNDDTYTVDITHLTSKLIDLEIALAESDKKHAA